MTVRGGPNPFTRYELPRPAKPRSAKRGSATTAAVGEEGAAPPRPTTLAVGEEGAQEPPHVTTKAVLEEGGGAPVTTMAVGEEAGR